MRELIQLFDFVWDEIERAGAIGRRPEGPTPIGVDESEIFMPSIERFSVSRHFESALALVEQSGFKQIANLVRESNNLLAWSQNPSYTEAKLGAHFMKSYVFGLLTGAGAALSPESPPSGFLLLGPHCEYPAHGHPPREIYLVLTPGAEWRLDGKKWFPVKPGKVICHAPNQVHAMRTHDTPMLAFAAWLDAGIRDAISI